MILSCSLYKKWERGKREIGKKTHGDQGKRGKGEDDKGKKGEKGRVGTIGKRIMDNGE